MNLDVRREGRDMEMKASTINSGGWCHGLVQSQPGMGGGGMEWQASLRLAPLGKERRGSRKKNP